MRTANKDMPERDRPGRRGLGRRRGACLTRAEAVARSLVLSCTPALWVVTR